MNKLAKLRRCANWVCFGSKKFARTIDPYSDENLEVPLKNPVPNPADDQVVSALVQYGFSDEPNKNEVPVTSPSKEEGKKEGFS